MMATKTSHYRATQQKTQLLAFSSTVALSFIVGAMMGCAIALGWMG